MNSIEERVLAETIERDDSIPASTKSRRASARLPTRESSMTERSDTRSPTVSWSSQLSSRSASTPSTVLSSLADDESEAIIEEEDIDVLSVDGRRRDGVGSPTQRDFDVERILGKRVENGVVWYKVRWEPVKVSRLQTELDEEGRWTVEIDGGKWRDVVEIRPVNFSNCEVIWKDSERPVWGLSHAMAKIAAWHEKNPEETDANEPKFWLGHRAGRTTPAIAYGMEADTDIFLDREFFDHLEAQSARSQENPSSSIHDDITSDKIVDDEVVDEHGDDGPAASSNEYRLDATKHLPRTQSRVSMMGNMSIDDSMEDFLDSAPAVTNNGDDDCFGIAPDAASDQSDEDQSVAHRFRKPYTRTPTAELYSSTPRPANLSQQIAGECVFDEHATLPTRSSTISQHIAASSPTAAYSTPPTQPLTSLERAAGPVPGIPASKQADKERSVPDIDWRTHGAVMPRPGDHKMMSTERTMDLPIRATPAPRSSSTMRASPAESRVSQADSSKAPSSVFHTPLQSAMELQKPVEQMQELMAAPNGMPNKNSAVRPDVSPDERPNQVPDPKSAGNSDVKSTEMPDGRPDKRPGIEQNHHGKKRAAPDHSPEDVVSFKEQEQSAPGSHAHQPKRTRHSTSPRTKSETPSATKMLFLNDHLYCTPGRPCIDPIATFSEYIPPKTPLVYNDREFEENEATVEEVRYVVSQCQCENAEILSKLARGSFEKLWRKGELESEENEEWSVEGNLSGRFWQELNKAVKLVCPSKKEVRKERKGKQRKVVIDLT
ncbi:hypothetical protein CKM354_001284300 [Cercospora kikuchii]|uniref:Chromo domain-containing protein n=1 Tax=Cercospora kikuchii TaxID=84275 RepID=A0A9P3FMQ6_9PEZI|nr:uncharacterized protein CKM354_001284300 [Cercospora kikuchii]GIZ49818.1 hypothetical protein CKM354_001284300 [Cercospora kikuchii]